MITKGGVVLKVKINISDVVQASKNRNISGVHVSSLI